MSRPTEQPPADPDAFAKSVEAAARDCPSERVRNWLLALVAGDRRERAGGHAATPTSPEPVAA